MLKGQAILHINRGARPGSRPGYPLHWGAVKGVECRNGDIPGGGRYFNHCLLGCARVCPVASTPRCSRDANLARNLRKHARATHTSNGGGTDQLLQQRWTLPLFEYLLELLLLLPHQTIWLIEDAWGKRAINESTHERLKRSTATTCLARRHGVPPRGARYGAQGSSSMCSRWMGLLVCPRRGHSQKAVENGGGDALSRKARTNTKKEGPKGEGGDNLRLAALSSLGRR